MRGTWLLWCAEWRRLRRQPAVLAVLAALLAVLLASAVHSGLGAAAWRAQVAKGRAEAQAVHAREHRAAVAGAASVAAALATFQFARQHAPPMVLEGEGGLALAPAALAVLSPWATVTVESRRTDARQGEPLHNPLLAELGLPDFATVAALLLPLAVLLLAGALRQEAQEAGLWRWMQAQSAQAGRWLRVALAWRLMAVWACAAAASVLAHAIDPGATAAALLWWLGALMLYVAVWGLAAACLWRLPV